MKQFDYAIVGAGMAGASLAAELAPHANVLLLEAEDHPGYHATGRSAAFWTETYGGPLVQPLTTASGPWLAEHGFLRTRGALTIGRQQDGAMLDHFAAQFAGSGVRMDRLDHAAMLAHVPGLAAQWCDGIYEPDCSDIDVAGLHGFMLQAAAKAGAMLAVRAQVTALDRIASGWQIATQAGEFKAAHIINAAGAWADDIARLAAIAPLGIQPLRRTVVQLRTTPAAPATLPLVLDIHEGFYFKPEAGKLWLSPHDEHPCPPCDAAAEEMDVALAISRFQSVVGWQIDGVERRWAGLRSFAPDRLPVYGADPADPAFIWFAGQGGFGIQTAPAAARLVAQQLLGHPPDNMTAGITLSTFAPTRIAT